ncbi:unnamed protein product, partial [Darwinula stevensoni]
KIQAKRSKLKKLVVIHIYSHTSVKIEEVENIERGIVAKMSHATFLHADLDADWTKDLFWDDNDRKKSPYWIIVMSETPADLDAIHELFSQWDITPLGYTEMGPEGPTWMPTCRTKILSLSDLSAFIAKIQAKRSKLKKLVVIHIYSHTSVKIEEVENIERGIVAKMSHATFLHADLDADWTKDLFWDDNDRKKSPYWIIVMSETPADLDAIHELFSQWDITPLGYTEMGPEGPTWVFGGYSGNIDLNVAKENILGASSPKMFTFTRKRYSLE